MSLVTRCPACRTAYRVTPAQLVARAGRVRCGRCRAVFDAVAALEGPRGEAPAPSAAGEPSPQLNLFGEPSAAPATALAPPAAAVPAAAQPSSEPAFDVPFLQPRPAARSPRRAAWAAASVLALAALAAQIIHDFRTEIAVLLPELRPVLARLCSALGCELRLPQRPELMAIESSELQADPHRDGSIVLRAVIRNRAPFAQEYPALELSLTDERDEVVLRRVLRAADYLGRQARARVAEGIAAGEEANVRLAFTAGGLRAVGYRLYLFYP